MTLDPVTVLGPSSCGTVTYTAIGDTSNIAFDGDRTFTWDSSVPAGTYSFSLRATLD